jgi:16S rRNA (adenine1518-N6/adenine1519-N6)-dimethyltransferase
MPIYKPSELHQFLEQIGAFPKKGLSQNFLIDQNILKKMVATADVKVGDFVLEVGPGPGSLTEELLASGARLVAVEKDRCFADALNRLKNPSRVLEIYCEDIMSFSAESALKGHLHGAEKAKLIANLPYHLTTPLLALFVKQHSLFSTLVVMVQEEVARRFVAMPRTKEYSSFTLFLNFYSRVRYAFKVSKHCFYPQPTVDSAVVVLDLKEPEIVSDTDAFFKVTRTAFEHRRKMLRGSLKELYSPSKIEKVLQLLKLNPMARPEDLSLQEFLSFFENLQNSLDL